MGVFFFFSLNKIFLFLWDLCQNLLCNIKQKKEVKKFKKKKKAVLSTSWLQVQLILLSTTWIPVPDWTEMGWTEMGWTEVTGPPEDYQASLFVLHPVLVEHFYFQKLQ